MPNKIESSQAVKSAYMLGCESEIDCGEGNENELNEKKRWQMKEDRRLMNEIWTDLKRRVIKSANQLIEDPENKLSKKDLGLCIGDRGTEIATENDEAYFLFKIDQIIRQHKKKSGESKMKKKNLTSRKGKGSTEKGDEKSEDDLASSSSSTASRPAQKSEIISQGLVSFQGVLANANSDTLRKLENLEKDLIILRHFPIYWKTKKVGEDKVAINPVSPGTVQWVTKKSEKYPDKRPRVTLEITSNSSGRLGDLVICLYSDYVPETCRNFLAYCHTKKNSPSYMHCPFTTIIPNLFCQTGDVTDFNGAGGATIFGKTMKDENFLLSHGEPGVLSMHNIGPDTNKSQFYITFRDVKSLDGCHVAFGKVIHGMETLKLIERFGTKRNGIPTDLIYISNCYEV